MSKIQIAPTLIHVVAKHEQEIQELKRLVSPMKKMIDAAIEMERSKKEWVGLTGPEVDEAYKSVSDREWAIGGLADARVFFCAIEAKLKQKNGGNSAVDTELQRLGCPL